MKKITFNAVVLFVAVTALTSCKKEVSDITLNVTKATLSPIETLTLIPEISPSKADDKTITWKSDNTSVATVSDGIVTPVEYGTATITATTANGKTATCTVTVNLVGTVTFRTDRTWTIGDQTWSDAITATGAQKDTFYGGTVGDWKADCRKNRVVEDPELPDLFTWEAVKQYKEQLCPAPWRVPTKEDFIALDVALGGTGANGQILTKGKTRELYVDKWGGQIAGHAFGPALLQTGIRAWYWSQTEENADNAFNLFYFPNGEYIGPINSVHKEAGFPVRCVK